MYARFQHHVYKLLHLQQGKGSWDGTWGGGAASLSLGWQKPPTHPELYACMSLAEGLWDVSSLGSNFFLSPRRSTRTESSIRIKQVAHDSIHKEEGII